MYEQKIHFRFGHVGINALSAEQARKVASVLSELFALSAEEGDSSIYSCSQIEIMKTPGRGTHGHIGILTNDLHGAIAVLEARGIAFDHSAFKYDPAGKLLAAYLRDEVCGFALHLSEKG